jgi:hypothetical protein
MCQIFFGCENIFMSYVTFKMRLLCLHYKMEWKFLCNKILKYIIYKCSNTHTVQVLDRPQPDNFRNRILKLNTNV